MDIVPFRRCGEVHTSDPISSRDISSPEQNLRHHGYTCCRMDNIDGSRVLESIYSEKIVLNSTLQAVGTTSILPHLNFTLCSLSSAWR